MKIEQEQSLNEGNLKTFITEKKSEITEAKDLAVTKIQKKVNRLRKQDPATEEEKTSISKEADVLSEAVAFLRDIPPDKLMSLALLDQRVFSEDYSNSEATAEQRAVFRFASMNSIQPAIHLFHEQYPDWKNAGENLMSKMELNNNNNAAVTDEPKKKKKKKKKAAANKEQNNNSVVCSNLINGAVTDGPKKKKNKKKAAKGKQDGNRKAHSELTNGAVVDGEPKKKRKKKNAKKGLKRKGEVTEKVGNSNEEGEVPQKKFKKSEDCGSATAMELDDSKNKAKTKNPKKKSKQNAIEKLMSRCKNKPKTVMLSLAEMSGNSGISSLSGKDEEKPEDGLGSNIKDKFNTTPYIPNHEKSPNHLGRGGKPNGFSKRGGRNEFEGRSPGPGSNRFDPAMNGFRGRNSSRGSQRAKGNDGPLPAWKIRRIVPRSSANVISISDDWKKKADAPKEEGGEQKESLLRPSWLTNPEEYKPTPMTFGRHGHRNFQRREPSSANMIRVSSDWKDKMSPKKDDTESTGDNSSGTSLLKPAWLTNPENNPPPPTFTKFRGNSRGRGRGGRWGRGRGRK